MAKHDFTAIQWGQEFTADFLVITGEGALEKGDVVLMAFKVEHVDRYPDHPSVYQAQLIASPVVPRLQITPKASQPNFIQRGMQWLLGGC